ncbi:hypothetical protein HN615_08600 [Candidatus Woesearchaeota archaeon]|jgi:hypothetical protein|nr:hypothetical protein [Candidatus Woesearchaeota archaeon]
MKLNNTIAIGCLVQFYEIRIIEDYIKSVSYALENVDNKENVIIDICFNMNEKLESIDRNEITSQEIVKRMDVICAKYNVDFWINKDRLFTIADYRREFNEKYCEKVDVLMWGESDSLIPRQTFEILDNLHTAAKETTPKYVGFFSTCKMWDDSWKILEHPDFTDKPFTEQDLTNWWSLRYNMTQDEMDKINDKVDDLDIQVTDKLKFNGCGLVISSDVIKSGVNIPKSVFFVHEDTAFMNSCLIQFKGKLPQYIIKNILLVHNRKLPKKRSFIKGQDYEDDDQTRMREQQYWYKNANKMSQVNAFNLTEQGYTYTWEDVFRDYEK